MRRGRQIWRLLVLLLNPPGPGLGEHRAHPPSDPFRTFCIMNKSLILAALVSAVALAACSKQEEAPAPAPVAAPAPAPVPAPAPAEPASAPEAAASAEAPASAASQ